MRLTLVVAASQNGIIGRNGALPWRLPGDLQRFKHLTMGHPIIMGRKTWESIGRPLPGRASIVVTHQVGYHAAGAQIAASLEEALRLAQPASEAFVIGGASLYAEALPRVDRIHLTRVRADVEGDVRLPEIDWKRWRRISSEDFPADDRNLHACRVEIFERC